MANKNKTDVKSTWEYSLTYMHTSAVNSEARILLNLEALEGTSNMSLLNYVPNFLNQVLLFVQLNLTKIISNVLGDIWKFPLKR